jgi:hypothetical protein
MLHRTDGFAKKIELQDADATYIFVGDLIDRGKNVWEILTWAMEHYSNILPTGVNRYHSLDDFEPIIRFFESLPYSKRIETVSIVGVPVIFRIVHANYNYSLPEHSRQQYDENLYARNYWGAKNNGSDEDIMVIGHTPTISKEFNLRHYQDRPGLICYRHNLINVDCGCVFAKYGFQVQRAWRSPCMLGAICLETLEEIYPYTLEERFKVVVSEDYKQPLEKHLFSHMTIDEYSKYCLEDYLEHYGMHSPEDNIYRKEMCVRLGIG